MIHAIVDVLITNAGVQSAIGKDIEKLGYKVYETLAPQGTQLPFVTVHYISSTADDDKDGVSDLDVIRVQVSSFAETSKEAYTISQACRTAIERYSGTNQSIVIQSVQFLTSTKLYEEDAKVHHWVDDYKVRQEI
jgi:hypothetical protein